VELPAFVPTPRLTGRPDPGELALVGSVGLIAIAIAAAATEQPGLALAGIAALAVVVTALLRTDFAILLVVASAPLEAAFATGPAGISVTKLTGGLCFASFAVTLARTRRPLMFDVSQAIVLGILAIAMVSTMQAQHPSEATATTTRYASFAIFFFIVTQFAHDRVLQRRIAWVLSFGVTAAALIGLYEYFTGNLESAGLRYANPGDFGFMLATTLPFMFWLLRSRKLLWPLVIGMIGIVFGAILLSLVRGALLGLAVGFVFFVLTDRRRLQLLLAGGLLASVVTVLVVHTNPARFHEAILLKSNIAQQNVSTRYQAWEAASTLASDHPFFGIGPGNFPFYYFKLTGRPIGTAPITVVHNAFLDIAAELGVIAMCLFILYLVVSFSRLSAAIRLGLGEPGIALAARVSLVIATTISLTVSEQYFLPFWLLGALATGIWIGQRDEGHSAAAQ
jgi:O-antigen ligase